MSLYRIDEHTIEPLPRASFSADGFRERDDLQRLLRDAIEIVAPDTMVVDEEFSDWADSRRRIDLLCLDRAANLVVVELKRTEDGGHMELQALRYAAMLEHMTFERLVTTHRGYLARRGWEAEDAEARLLEFLGWDQPDERTFNSQVRIVLVASGFSTELTTTVLWLNKCQLDIRCVQLTPHRHGDELIVSVGQCLPLPSAEKYQVQLREKALSERAAGQPTGPWTGVWFMNVGDEGGKHAHRSWEDCRRYGFMIGGYDEASIRLVQKPQPGELVFAYESGYGYVGVGRVTRAAVPQDEFNVDEENGKRLIDLPLTTPPDPERLGDPQRCDWCIGVDWLHAVDRAEAILKRHAYRGTACAIRQQAVVEDVLDEWGLELPERGGVEA